MATATAPKRRSLQAQMIRAVVWSWCLHSAAAAPYSQWPQPQPPSQRYFSPPGPHGPLGYTGYTYHQAPVPFPYRQRLHLPLAPARAPIVSKMIYVLVENDGAGEVGDQQLLQALPSLVHLLGGQRRGQGLQGARPGAESSPPPPGAGESQSYDGDLSPGRQPSKTPVFVDDEDPPIPDLSDDEEASVPDTSPSNGSSDQDHTEYDYNQDNPSIDVRSGNAGTGRVKPATLKPQSKLSDVPVFA